MASRISVAKQAEELAKLCGLESPWVILRVVMADGSYRAETRETICQLKTVRLSPVRWNRVEKRWTDDPTGRVALSCSDKHWQRGVPVVRAKVKSIGIGQIENGGKIKEFRIGPASYERRLWCFSCAKARIAEYGGSLDWLIGQTKSC